MAVKKVFKSRSKNVSYVFGCSNKKVLFIQGNYFTANDDEIAELEKEIKNGHPMFYIDPDDFEIDTEKENKALTKLKEEAVAEYKASLEPKEGDSSSEQPKLNVAGTDKIRQMMAGSTSTSPAE